MDDSLAHEFTVPMAKLPHKFPNLILFHFLLRLQDLPQSLAVASLLDNINIILRLHHIDEFDYMRMLELGMNSEFPSDCLFEVIVVVD